MESSNGDRGKILADDPNSGGIFSSKLLVALVTVAILLASVALIVSLISITQTNGGVLTVAGGSSGQDDSSSSDGKIWTIAIGHMINNNVYIDAPSGQLKGFHVDMINAVCRLANKNCRLMYDVWNRCWFSKAGEVPRGGEGLLGKWYDACAGWTKSYERARTCRFALPWQNPSTFYFYVKAGNPNNFNPKDVTGVKFGFVDGWVTDEFCVARQTDVRGSTLSPSQIRHYPTRDDVNNAIISGEVTASVGSASADGIGSSLLLMDSVSLDCSIDESGGGIMTRMDNGFVDWWDPAQQRLMQTSEYSQICQNIRQEHAHMPGRDPDEICK